MEMNDMACMMKQKMKQSSKPMALALGMVLGAVAAGVATVVVCNSKQVKTARMVKSAENIMYRIGTAMRDVSGMGGM